MWGWESSHGRFAPDAGAGQGAAGLPLAAADVAELAAIASRAAAEYGVSSPVVLSATLSRLIRRQVPLRAVTSTPEHGIGELQFADGTVVTVGAGRAGELGRLAAGVLRYPPVRLTGFCADRSGVRVELSYHGRHDHLAALGSTQPV